MTDKLKQYFDELNKHTRRVLLVSTSIVWC